MEDAPRKLQVRIGLATPDEAAATRAAASLSGAGLDVLGVGARGLLVEGSAGAIERAFHVTIESVRGSPQFEVAPDLKSLLDIDASGAYFPRQPEFFKR